jgi:hypothetical protein
MQAMLFFGLFGFMAAVIGGIIALSNVTAQKLRLMLLDQTHQQFKNVATVINEQYVRSYLQSPVPSGGTSQDIGPFICALQEVRQLIDCSTGLPKDPWGHDVTGKVVRQMKAFSTTNNLVFSVPVTAYAMLSAGPDGIVDTTLPPNPTTIAQLTALTATNDDILEVFTDAKGQQDNVNAVQGAMDHMGLAVQKQYQEQFGQIKSGLQNMYANINGNTDITSAQMQNAWKVWTDSSHQPPAVGDPNYTTLMTAYRTNIIPSYPTPSLNKLFTGAVFNPYTVGADGDLATIQRTLPSGGSMGVTASVSDSDFTHYGINDVILISITTAGTVWPQVTSNCNSTPPINCLKLKGTI